MSTWQRILRAILPIPENECLHPKDRWFWDDGCGGEPAMDTSCRDCRAILVHGSPPMLAGTVTEQGRRAGIR